ncbi:MAG TPA: matrixin family metalloprotease [Solirubrobacteraceae bacterium]
MYLRAARVTVAALGIGLAVVASPSPAAAAAPPSAAVASPCAGLGQLSSPGIARAARPDGGSELTQFFGDGGYRVSRCDRSGHLQVSETVSPIRDPDGGVTLVPTETQTPTVEVSALYGDPSEPAWAADFRARRAALRAAILPPTVPATSPAAGDLAGDPLLPGVPVPAPAGGSGTAAAAIAGDACTNAQYTLWMGAWASRNYDYRINRSSFNYNDTTVASIVDGHTNWDTTSNGCGLNDITNLTSHYLGSTSAGIHTVPDGQSITDKGDLDNVGCAGALACTWLFTDANANATETDQRFNDDYTFSNVGAAGAYDYESVATHESGHSIGLGHADSSNALTMYPSIAAGSTAARTLAKGDVMGLRARYP